jgi:DNA-binding MarR family transcriptional regulator
MVVKSTSEPPPALDLGYLALFLGLRINQLVAGRMRAAGFQDIRESHGDVIQHLIDRGRSITELARRMEITQQAASKIVAELTRLGIIDLVPAPDRRAKLIQLSPRGWEAVRTARRIRHQLEKRLIRAAGAQHYDAAKSILSACLDKLGGMDRVRRRRVPPPQ